MSGDENNFSESSAATRERVNESQLVSSASSSSEGKPLPCETPANLNFSIVAIDSVLPSDGDAQIPASNIDDGNHGHPQLEELLDDTVQPACVDPPAFGCPEPIVETEDVVDASLDSAGASETGIEREEGHLGLTDPCMNILQTPQRRRMAWVSMKLPSLLDRRTVEPPAYKLPSPLMSGEHSGTQIDIPPTGELPSPITSGESSETQIDIPPTCELPSPVTSGGCFKRRCSIVQTTIHVQILSDGGNSNVSDPAPIDHREQSCVNTPIQKNSTNSKTPIVGVLKTPMKPSVRMPLPDGSVPASSGKKTVKFTGSTILRSMNDDEKTSIVDSAERRIGRMMTKGKHVAVSIVAQGGRSRRPMSGTTDDTSRKGTPQPVPRQSGANEIASTANCEPLAKDIALEPEQPTDGKRRSVRSCRKATSVSLKSAADAQMLQQRTSGPVSIRQQLHACLKSTEPTSADIVAAQSVGRMAKSIRVSRGSFREARKTLGIPDDGTVTRTFGSASGGMTDLFAFDGS
ncbi:hypothetical protein HDV00_003867 [Rhizophlyctis rosea]|nr:hypothetical protein HDV00_003867 [Rhizophlyctis rosea]